MKFLVFFLTFCCTSMLDENHLQIDKRVLPFINVVKVNNLIIEFTPLIESDGVIGKTFYGPINTIKLDTSLLSSLKVDTLFFETVLYHELGHAVMGRNHCYDCYSLMNPNRYIQDFRFDPIKRQKLINELFK